MADYSQRFTAANNEALRNRALMALEDVCVTIGKTVGTTAKDKRRRAYAAQVLQNPHLYIQPIVFAICGHMVNPATLDDDNTLKQAMTTAIEVFGAVENAVENAV